MKPGVRGVSTKWKSEGSTPMSISSNVALPCIPSAGGALARLESNSYKFHRISDTRTQRRGDAQ